MPAVDPRLSALLRSTGVSSRLPPVEETPEAGATAAPTDGEDD